MNPTIEKFGYPESRVAEYRNWIVLLRPAQATLGALVLAHKSAAEAFSSLDPESFAELGAVVKDIETGLQAFRPYQKINYLMLMMVDRQVHFHVLPRYDSPQAFGALSFEDRGWPGQPDLGGAPELGAEDLRTIRDAVKSAWPK